MTKLGVTASERPSEFLDHLMCLTVDCERCRELWGGLDDDLFASVFHRRS